MDWHDGELVEKPCTPIAAYDVTVLKVADRTVHRMVRGDAMAVEDIGVVGRYRLGRSVGAGGMGRVWLARDEILGRDVAIKEIALPFGLSDNDRQELRQRTLREARAAARLNHPNVIKIYDVVNGEVRPWIVMEYVRSRSLLEIIEASGPLPVQDAARVGIAVLSALTAANRVGVLHRDIKPSNVLIGDDGRVVLTDFGSAIYEGTEGAAITRTGVILGSPQYIAPERARSGVCTVESDLWSLGATLYAAVEGRAPYHRPTPMATLIALATERPDPPTRAGALKPVLTGLLRKNPNARMSALEVERRLRKITGQTTAVTLPRIPAPRPSPESPAAAPLEPGTARGTEPVQTGPTASAGGSGGWSGGGSGGGGGSGVTSGQAGEAGAAGAAGGRRRPWWQWAAAGGLAILLIAVGAVLVRNDGLPGRSADPPPAWVSSGPAVSPASAGSETPPAGFVWWHDPSGYQVAVPAGWDLAREDATTMLFSDPAAPLTLRVRVLSGSSQDPEALTGTEGGPPLPGYQRIRIEQLAQNLGTEWEYAFDGPTGRIHAIERVFVVDGRGYSIQWRTPDAQWQANRDRFAVIVGSFRSAAPR